MTEDDLTRRVLKLAADHGLLAHHCADSRYSCQGPAGFPDMLIAGENGVIVAELKTDTGDTSAKQDLWLWALHRAFKVPVSGFRVTVWRPADLEDGTIGRQMEEIK